MTPSNDTARCNGDGSDEEGWREGCEHCLRRIAQRLLREAAEAYQYALRGRH